MKKRKTHWLYPPTHYEVRCDKCKGSEIDWSEYDHKIWCYQCQIDTDGDGGIFDGPIPWGACQMMLGTFCFHKWDMVRKCILEPFERKMKNGRIHLCWRKMKNKPKIKEGPTPNL